MKKNFICFFLCLCICDGKLFAQDQFGVSVMPVFAHPMKIQNMVIPKNQLLFGIRGEIMKTKLGIDWFRFAYIGLALSYFPYPKENVTVQAYQRDNADEKDFTGILKQSELDGILKIGFEIPQHWNDFLYLNMGLGAGILKGKRTYVLDGFDAQKYALPTSNNGEPVEKGYGYMSDYFFSVFYEREKFYLFSQLDLIADYGDFTGENFYVRINAGIYYTFNKTDK
ncbi:MAG TPA: hypothetical protein VFJ43_13900 [Bacteroidia bacterium]|nr:hypothetical protein [Bacteroidia bacterium]